MQQRAKFGISLSTVHLLYANPSKDLSEKDYYPGGMVMPDRSFANENYGFGFNGKLKDDEVKGSGNSYDYGFRMYDPRIGKFLSLDPLFKSYPFYSPYQFAGNNPILFIDLDGLERDFHRRARKQIRCFNNWDIQRSRLNLGLDFGELFTKKPEAGSPSFGYIKSKEAPYMEPIKTEGIGLVVPNDENKIEPIARNPTINIGADTGPEESRGGEPRTEGKFDGHVLKKDTPVDIEAELATLGVRSWEAPITAEAKEYFGKLAQELKGTGISEISIRLTYFDALGTGHAINEVVKGDPGEEAHGNKLSIYNALLHQTNQAADLIRKANPNIKVNAKVDITIDQSKQKWQTTIIQ